MQHVPNKGILLQMTGQPAMGISGVEEVELAPFQVPQRCGDRIRGGGLRSKDGDGEERREKEKRKGIDHTQDRSEKE